MTVAPFGKVGDTPVQLYTLTNKNGLVAKITNYGAIVTELHVPDRDGTLADVVLGFENLDGYVERPSVFRRHRRARRQSHRERRVHARGQALHARRQRQAPPPARRQEEAGTRWSGTPRPSIPPKVRRSS